MTLLEVVSNATVKGDQGDTQSDYPIVLNPDGICSNLKPKLENPNPSTLINPLSGWEISRSDAEIIDLGKGFSSKLKRKLKDTNSFGKDEFIGMLKPFLEKIGEKFGISAGVDHSDKGYIRALIEKTGLVMGRDVAGLILEGCVRLEIWELVETFVTNSMVDHSSYSGLVRNLVGKKQSDLLCLVIKHASDLGAPELLLILKYFLCPSKEAFGNMVKVREEWDNQALLAIEKASDTALSAKKSRVARDASILLMVAHDGFSTPELCLHFLLASKNVDDVMLASAVNKLSGKEMAGFIRYLSKWLKKYESFPQAGPCPKAASMFGLKLCNWVPRLGDVAKYLGLILDENFSTVVLYSDVHEELKSIEGVVHSLASESKVCCFMANVVESMKLGCARD
ncbi:PREDICTED: uncharacterized protein LOC104808328 [Tarenaya hassleriana]|uniref:uncharacterized protein LOC104808328 n=1 Tax=Tarenaya hassleriana TaxID=28532 RepID=UPI00053C24FE|nr:PREDICTED: uncharacterized protein LOC104808328 [Tarenaya hassleriana]XP_010532307.1 PREDICTED: uncharacterized protein LOC104808328 [Tarenaya hassleriana]